MSSVAAGDADGRTQLMPRRLAHYELLQRVGEGAMGVVYKARDTELDRWVAIKRLHAAAAQDAGTRAVERLVNEARAAARLSHPNVAQVFQIGQDAGLPYIVMEWIAGSNLSAWVQAQGPLPWRAALTTAREAAAALAAAHRAGLIHRDIKPSNLIRLHEDGLTKVVDFGLARLLDGPADLTRSGTLLGTPSYMAPEQCQGEEATPASDLYSLGCTLFFLLTGRAPFVANHALAVLDMHVRQPLPDLRALAPQVPEAVQRIVERLCAKLPAQRYADAGQLLRALDEAFAAPAPDAEPTLVIEPPPAAPPASRLPAERNAFIGRESLLARIDAQLDDTRLLTLVGPGGAGKTRLALQLARRRVAAGTQEAVWVDLAPLPAGASALEALARAAEVDERQGRDLADALRLHFGTRRTLVVLDNCEHLLAAATQLADMLLNMAPALTLLATSRQPLALPGESLHPIEPMQLCEPGATMDALIANEAVQLFTARAKALRASFEVDAHTVDAVARICRRLDGLPLAIELAAARVNVLSPTQIADRLGELFKLLSGGSRSLQPRQQTLRELIDWSHQLLDPGQRLLFARLSLFRGEFDIDDAEVVVADAMLPAQGVLDRLSELADRSMLVTVEHGGRIRLRLLQTMRQYAAEKLAADPGLPALRRRYVAVLAARCSEQAEQLEGGNAAAAKARLASLLDDAGCAFEMALEDGALDDALRLATALARHDQHCGRASESLARAERLLALQPPATLALARLLEAAGAAALSIGRWTQAGSWFEHGLAIADTLADPGLRSDLLRHLGSLAYRAEDCDAALRLFGQAREAAREAGQVQAEAHALANMGAVATEQMQPALARAHWQDALAIYRRQGNLRAQARMLGNLGIVEHDLGDAPAARRHFDESLRLHQGNADARGIAFTRFQLGGMLLDQGDAAAAEDLLRQSIDGLRPLDDAPTLAAALDSLALALLQQGQAAPARAAARESLALRLGFTSRNDLSDSLTLFAELSADTEPESAAGLLGAAARVHADRGTQPYPRHRRKLDRLATRLRDRLGPQAFERCHAAGQGAGDRLAPGLLD